MSRLDQIIEQLFARPGATLLLESDSPGVIEQAGADPVSAFRQPLRTGQILLLFADVVPKDMSNAFLAGTPIEFWYTTRLGRVFVAMELKGPTARVRLKPDVIATAPVGHAPAHAPIPTPVPQQIPVAISLIKLVEAASSQGATHVHWVAKTGWFARIDGKLVRLNEAPQFTAESMREALATFAPRQVREAVRHQPHFEFSCEIGESLLNVRAADDGRGQSVVIRCLPAKVPSTESRGVPISFASQATMPGLYFIGAGTGLEASQVMLSLVQERLSAAPISAVTVESPRSGVLHPGSGLVRQLEIGVQMPSLERALEDVRGHDADTIAFSDMAALKDAVALAQAGRTVFVAVPSVSAASLVDVVVENLPPKARAQLAKVTSGVLVVKQVTTTKGKVLVADVAMRGSALDNAFKTAGGEGLNEGLQENIDARLVDLVRQGLLTKIEAVAAANDPVYLESRLVLQAA